MLKGKAPHADFDPYGVCSLKGSGIMLVCYLIISHLLIQWSICKYAVVLQQWWSVGTILFELNPSVPPFTAEHPEVIYE
nr:probable serine/threonine protein kinase IRE4 isoform X3 [Ipomoea batatas]